MNKNPSPMSLNRVAGRVHPHFPWSELLRAGGLKIPESERHQATDRDP